jgi:hypothetical protein
MNPSLKPFVFLAPLLWSLLAPVPARAQDIGGMATTMIRDSALQGVQGRIAINVTAGDSNAQANAAALAMGSVAYATNAVHQSVDSRGMGTSTAALAVITDHAFAQANGLLAVNQASGTGNVQANLLAIAVGAEVEAVAESRLSATSAPIAPPGGIARARTREAIIADTAFDGARGLIQVNQTAGSGNATANQFVLIFQTGAK